MTSSGGGSTSTSTWTRCLIIVEQQQQERHGRGGNDSGQVKQQPRTSLAHRPFSPLLLLLFLSIGNQHKLLSRLHELLLLLLLPLLHLLSLFCCCQFRCLLALTYDKFRSALDYTLSRWSLASYRAMHNFRSSSGHSRHRGQKVSLQSGMVCYFFFFFGFFVGRSMVVL